MKLNFIHKLQFNETVVQYQYKVYIVLIFLPECDGYLTNLRGTIRTPLVPFLFMTQSVDCSWTIDGGINASSIILTINTEHMQLTSLSKGECIGDVYQKVTHSRRHYHLEEAPPYHYERRDKQYEENTDWTAKIVEHNDKKNHDDYHIDR